jgi:hypothetical protein
MVCEFEYLQNQDKAGYDVEGGLLWCVVAS